MITRNLKLPAPILYPGSYHMDRGMIRTRVSEGRRQSFGAVGEGGPMTVSGIREGRGRTWCIDDSNLD